MKVAAALTTAASMALMAACGGSGSSESPEDYPSKTITLLVGYEAGGAADLGGRAVAAALERKLGATVVVENRPGATGGVAMQQLANSDPDGYTLESISTSAAVTNPLTQKVDYTTDDYTLVGTFATYPWVYAVNADSPYQTAEEFFAAAKADPGGLKLGTPGASAQTSIQMLRMKNIYDTEVTVVPFSGASVLIPELLGNNIDALGMVSSADVIEQINAGELRALAVGGTERVDYLPDTPTLAEAGFPELTEATAYTGIGVTAGTDPEIIKILSDAIASLNEDEEFVKAVGADYAIDDPISGPELTERFAEQSEIYEDLLKVG
jgi:tripartite-type tricarboxylate transporter receptor subunit TctC